MHVLKECVSIRVSERVNELDREKGRERQRRKKMQTSKCKCLKQDDSFINNIVENDMKCMYSIYVKWATQTGKNRLTFCIDRMNE